eukprot:TRINITY_DN21736_c0_g1_i1.p1 TRINITY_DN21736_c0_g1~~TRINITY_DN21736_c0_g1_i1.p1  ORF type:complete len:286 (-),score=38.49 TRINITY_DN21736_c0_g1_i1:98-829(-)
MVPAQKVSAFRELATSLASRIVEQLTADFEREFMSMHTDLVNYKNELAHVTELLGNQLGRERQLHESLDAMSNHHTNITYQAQQVAQQQPNSKEIHELVDRMVGQQASIINSTLQGMTQVHSAAQSHAAQAKLLQEPMLVAENEFTRVMSMLQGQTAPMPSLGSTVPSTPPHPGRILPSPHGSHQHNAGLGSQGAYRQMPPQGVRGIHGGTPGTPYMARSPSAPSVQTPPHPGVYLSKGPAFA